jgi:transcriptional regulator with XRE-family HTH domain
MMSKLGQNVKMLREAKGWDQSELARYAGVKRPTLQTVETGKSPNPGLRIVRGIADAFGLSIDQLLDTETVKDIALQWFRERHLQVYPPTIDSQGKVLPEGAEEEGQQEHLDRDGTDASEGVPTGARSVRDSGESRTSIRRNRPGSEGSARQDVAASGQTRNKRE